MARYRMQTRRDRVMSLLPPISITSTTEVATEDRIFSDNPPPINYSGSFPSKILRHLENSTFYSAPTKGEAALISKDMYAEPDFKKEENQKNVPSFKKSRNPRDRNNNYQYKESYRKTVGYPNTKKAQNFTAQITNKQVNGPSGVQTKCFSAPSSKGYSRLELDEVEFVPGNLTAPTTPRFTGRAKEDHSILVKAESVENMSSSFPCTPTATPCEGMNREAIDVQLELRGDGIEGLSNTEEMITRVPFARPNSRANTPLQVNKPELDVTNVYQVRSRQGFYSDDTKGQIYTRGKPKLRSAIRDVPRPHSRQGDNCGEAPRLLVRAVGFTLHDNPRRTTSAMKRVSKNSTEVNTSGQEKDSTEDNISEKEAKLKVSVTLAIMGSEEDTQKDTSTKIEKLCQYCEQLALKDVENHSACVSPACAKQTEDTKQKVEADGDTKKTDKEKTKVVEECSLGNGVQNGKEKTVRFDAKGRRNSKGGRKKKHRR